MIVRRTTSRSRRLRDEQRRRFGGTRWGVYSDDVADSISYALAPAAVLAIALGGPSGLACGVAYAAFTTTFVVLISAASAVESVKQDYVLVARSYGATRSQILMRVYVPSMMPMLLEALRISMIFNFTGVMIAEMYASRTGIGHLISSWGENFQMRELFAGVIILSVVAILFNETVRFFEGRCSTWRT